MGMWQRKPLLLRVRLKADAETVPHIDHPDDVAQVTAFFLAEVFRQGLIGGVAIAALAEAGQVFGPAAAQLARALLD